SNRPIGAKDQRPRGALADPKLRKTHQGILQARLYSTQARSRWHTRAFSTNENAREARAGRNKYKRTFACARARSKCARKKYKQW
uniref:Uncharacterized protein n=1 Tax=Romanomermis culicivorax TaxID=13658 RepID=A0A915J509_ROMCU